MKSIFLLLVVAPCSAFVPTRSAPQRAATDLSATTDRRVMLASTLSFAATASWAPSAHAADTPPTAEELARIKTGYNNIVYLLENWEKETTGMF